MYVRVPSDHSEDPLSASSEADRHHQPRSGSERGADLPAVAQPGRCEPGPSSDVRPQAPASAFSVRLFMETAARPACQEWGGGSAIVAGSGGTWGCSVLEGLG